MWLLCLDSTHKFITLTFNIEVFVLAILVKFIQGKVKNTYNTKMGKGGDASATAGHRSMKLVGDKSEKITWAEVKKHVSVEHLRSTSIVFFSRNTNTFVYHAIRF